MNMSTLAPSVAPPTTINLSATTSLQSPANGDDNEFLDETFVVSAIDEVFGPVTLIPDIP